MKSANGNRHIEMINLIRERQKICSEWRQKVEAWIKDGSMSAEEGLAQLKKIKEEQAITQQYLARLDVAVNDLKIIKKNN